MDRWPRTSLDPSWAGIGGASGPLEPDLAAEVPAATVSRIAAIAHAAERDALAGDFAHRMSQPLGAIAAFAHAGERMLTRPQPMTEQAGVVFAEIARLAIEAGADLRRVRRLHSIRVPDPRRLNLLALLAETEALLTGVARRHGGCVIQAIDGELPEVHADPAALQYVLITLVDLAFEFGEPFRDPPAVRIAAGREHDAVIVDVIGPDSIPPGAAERRLGHPLLASRGMPGTTSLSTSRAIVESYRGSVGYERLAAGADRFWFKLPTVAV